MFLATNNEVIWSLKSPTNMVFRRKQSVRASAPRLLLHFVSSELAYSASCNIIRAFSDVKWLFHILINQNREKLLKRQRKPGHMQQCHRDSFDCCTERYEIVVYCCTSCAICVLPEFYTGTRRGLNRHSCIHRLNNLAPFSIKLSLVK